MAVGIWAVFTTASVLAATSDNGFTSDAAAGQAISTTGQGGSTLKWLPAQPAAQTERVDNRHVDNKVVATQCVVPTDDSTSASAGQTAPRRAMPRAAIAARMAQRLNSRVPDPFGDRRAVPTPAVRKMTGANGGRAAAPDFDAEHSSPGLMPEEPGASALAGSGTPLTLMPSAVDDATQANTDKSLQPLKPSAGAMQHELSTECPSATNLKPIRELTTVITAEEGDLPRDCPLGKAIYQPRTWNQTTYTWTASALCHKPLYFDDTALERYGHMWGPWLQPFVSGARFFGTVLILPYEMGVELPNECIYALGDHRPGNCAPYQLDPIPLSVRGAVFEAGAWAGGFVAFH